MLFLSGDNTMRPHITPQVYHSGMECQARVCMSVIHLAFNGHSLLTIVPVDSHIYRDLKLSSLSKRTTQEFGSWQHECR